MRGLVLVLHPLSSLSVDVLTPAKERRRIRQVDRHTKLLCSCSSLSRSVDCVLAAKVVHLEQATYGRGRGRNCAGSKNSEQCRTRACEASIRTELIGCFSGARRMSASNKIPPRGLDWVTSDQESFLGIRPKDRQEKGGEENREKEGGAELPGAAREKSR